ncbi:MAG: hypothetical protein U9R58_14495 [Chloroflexota bacterium]|nr:hypothetical protein [Chloroflexota bacterium]
MKEALESYIHTWQAVQEVEKGELASATFELRWQQLNSLLGLAIELGIFPQRDEQQEKFVMKRWAFLKGAGD